MKKQSLIATDSNKEATGLYVCAACGHPLFDASKKFEAGCGFPSFWMHKVNGVELKPLHTYGRSRTQLLCRQCGSHLGHLFTNKQTPSGLRYCINHLSIRWAKTPSFNQEKKMSFIEEIMHIVREHRSSESNFQTLLLQLEKARTWAEKENHTALVTELEEVKEKYAAAYQKAKENNGSAWPEFEKFVTQFERSLTNNN